MKYLGVFISEKLEDDIDIKRQVKCVYSKGNTLIRKFRACTNDVKTQLFQAFCTSMYCSPLWCHNKRSSFQQLRVAYNNVFRYLLNVKDRCSISHLFLSHNVDCFNVLYRKLVFSLYKRIFGSNNILVSTIASSMYFMYQSNLFKHWQNVLYNNV